MQVAAGHAVELIEHPLLVSSLIPIPSSVTERVISWDDTVPLRIIAAGLFSGILDCIPDQVAEHVIQMGTVGRYGHMLRYFCRDVDRFICF